MQSIAINKETFIVKEDEFKQIPHDEYNNLNIKGELGELERFIGLLAEITLIFNEKVNLAIYETSHGGYIPIKSCNHFNKVYLYTNNSFVKDNQENLKINNLFINQPSDNIKVIFINNLDNIPKNIGQEIIISKLSITLLGKYNNVYELTNTKYYVYVPDNLINNFNKEFHYFIKDNNKLDYNNLIHLTMIVKNAGDDFEMVLKENLEIIDYWTILDTGSTDNTIDIINRVLVGKKKGELFQEPFINFRESRNRCLDLAGKKCKFTLMLDDTYIIKGNLREFLNTVRGDQFSDSFSLYIKSDDVEYTSNRIVKTDRNLRYLFKIHEVITPKNNNNVIIPIDKAYIFDYRCDYMEKRTMNRKYYDLKLLFEEVEEDGDNPRHYYYIAQTYNLLEEHEKAYEYFLKRGNHHNGGFLQEKIDALFEAARLANFKLNKSWDVCFDLYNRAYELDKSRPDSLYFIGIHYYLENNKMEAYKYFKKGFEVGYPIHAQYSLKPTLSFFYLPKFLIELCYEFKNFILGENVARYFLLNNKPNTEYYDVMISWLNIFGLLNKMGEPQDKEPISNKPLLCFVADGGFSSWTGRDILTKGVGGSETYIIEMARYIQKHGRYQVVVFCKCDTNDIFEGVHYINISEYPTFVNSHNIHSVIVSRFSEYLPVAFFGRVENVYLVLHDLTPSGLVIPKDLKLKKIFCLTEWHVDYFTERFPMLKDITTHFYYGIDVNKFKNKTPIKNKNQFIYSSFPNRGLLPLLQMWDKIYAKYPDATLEIYCDVDGKWVNEVAPDQIKLIKELLEKHKDKNINYYGWVSKEELAKGWLSSEYWFYPCIFMETFCLTALECALTKTIAITNGLAALQNTVGDRGLTIKGEPMDNEWQEKALEELFKLMENEDKKNELIRNNNNWAKSLTWENQAILLLENHIMKEKMEYKGMYNWTVDIPTNTKNTFEIMITYFNESYKPTKPIIEILEIGTYTGTSLIKLVEMIPNSIGYGVDRWENYNENELLNIITYNKIEETFYKNINTAKLQERISGIKGDSVKVMLDFITNNKKFDFIYVDGSHLCLDCYTDLILAWKLLNNGGLLAIDDYLYNSDLETNNPLTSPREAVDHFIKKYEKELRILDKGYRVFLEKIDI